MATLGKIRERTGLLLAVIGIAMLAFILGDFLKSTNSGGGNINVGEVLGEDILIYTLQQKIDEGIENRKAQNPDVVLTETAIAGIRDQVWDEYIRELVMENEFEKIGIDVSDDEWMEQISGINVHSEIANVPAFQNEKTGQFDRTKILGYLKQIDQDPSGEARTRWVGFQKYLLRLIKTAKYNALVSKAMFTTTEEAKVDFNSNSQIATFNYVAIPFTSINDVDVKPTEKELNTYYDNHKYKYQQEASKDVDFVVYTAVPSLEDEATVKEEIASLVSDFESYEDYELMCRRNSDNTSSRFAFSTESELQDSKWKELFNASKGSVIGPYLTTAGVYRIAKLAEVEYRPDSVEARHILITPNQTMSLDSVNNRINALKLAIEGGANFADLARRNSEDQGSAIKGGDLGWFPEGRMVNEFNEVCFTSKKGDLSVVTTQFGVHLIEVTRTSKAVKKVKIAYIDRNIEPSTETFAAYYNKAINFSAKLLNEGINFDTLISLNNLVKRNDNKVTANKLAIVGLPNSREMVKWIYTADVGSVSEVFQFDNSYVVAYVTKEYLEGAIPLEDIKEEITSLVLKEKKGKKILEGITTSDLVSVASTSKNTIIRDKKAKFGDLSIQGIGQEPALVGAIFATNPGEASLPIVGKNAVYVFEVTSIDEPKLKEDFSQQKKQLQKQAGSYAKGESYNALKDAAKVQDNRVDFF